MTKEKEIELAKCYVSTTKGVFPISVLKDAEKPKSKQIEAAAKYLTQHDLIPLPFEAESLLTLKDNCAYFDACVKQIAQDVIGQGYTLVPKETEKEDEEKKNEIETFFNESGGDRDEYFMESLKRGLIDWGVIGWMALEVSRGPDNKINGIWHIPAQTIRIHKSHNKFCQIRNNIKVWFKRFGEEKDISSKDGEEYKGRAGKYKANELIYYKNYYPQSDYYGAPNILPAVGSVFGIIGVRDYNLAFFENYGVPIALILFKGKWEKEAPKAMSDFLELEIKGAGNAHRSMIMTVPEKDQEIEIRELGVKDKEGSFKLYLKGLRDDVLVCYKMPPYRIGIAETGSLGGSTASESTKIYAGGVIGPLEQDMNRIVTTDILKDGMECETFDFVLNKMDVRDLDAEIKRYKELFGIASMTPNQIIEKIGIGETYDDGNQYYVGSNFLPVGEESVEKRERAMQAEMEELRAKINDIIEKEAKK